MTLSRKKPWRGKRDLYEDGRRCPRSVKTLRAWCEHLKAHIAERAARAEEDASAWRECDGQRWAALTLLSVILQEAAEPINTRLDRLNALLHEAEMSGAQPIDAIINLGKEMELDKRIKDWEETALKKYDPKGQRHRPRRRKPRKKRASTKAR